MEVSAFVKVWGATSKQQLLFFGFNIVSSNINKPKNGV